MAKKAKVQVTTEEERASKAAAAEKALSEALSSAEGESGDSAAT